MVFSLFSRKGAAKSRDFEGCALGLQYVRALPKFELQAFTCYSVGLLIKSRGFTLSVSLAANRVQKQKAWFLLLQVKKEFCSRNKFLAEKTYFRERRALPSARDGEKHTYYKNRAHSPAEALTRNWGRFPKNVVLGRAKKFEFSHFSAICRLRNAEILRGNPNGFPLAAR